MKEELVRKGTRERMAGGNGCSLLGVGLVGRILVTLVLLLVLLRAAASAGKVLATVIV